MTNFIRENFKDKSEWLKIRGKGIGGSDSSAALGLNPYKTNLQLWQEKLGLISFDNFDNRFTIYGKAAEDPIRQIFQARNPNTMIVKHFEEVLIRKDKPYLRASLDGEIEMIEDKKFTSYFKYHYVKAGDNFSEPKEILLEKGMKGVLEIKTTEVLSSMSKEKWSNSIPMNYYIQVLHYLMVTNYDFAIIVAQLNWIDKNEIETQETRHYGFLRKDVEEEIKYLEEQLDVFWNYVTKKIEPPLKIN